VLSPDMMDGKKRPTPKGRPHAAREISSAAARSGAASRGRSDLPAHLRPFHRKFEGKRRGGRDLPRVIYARGCERRAKCRSLERTRASDRATIRPIPIKRTLSFLNPRQSWLSVRWVFDDPEPNPPQTTNI
jgi:hypothetical protein